MTSSGTPEQPALNHYEMLGVPPTSTPDQIRLAYRRAIRVCHPDHNGNDPAAAELFRTLTKAYRVLRDPELRMIFDASLGLGEGYRPWYGSEGSPRPADKPRTGVARPQRTGPNAAAAATLAANGLSAAEVAASLIEMGCPYEEAWESAWLARHDLMSDRMNQPASPDHQMPGGPVSKGAWQPHRESNWIKLRQKVGRILR